MKRTDIWMMSEHLAFGLWHEGDEALARRLWGNPQVTALICATGVFTDEEILARLSTEILNGKQLGVQYWPIFLNGMDEEELGELVGCCGLRPDGDEGDFELGFHLLPEFWGQGYATEAAQRVINYAFNDLKLPRLFAGHNPKNSASARVIEKLGFTYIGDTFYEPTGLMHPGYELEAAAV